MTGHWLPSLDEPRKSLVAKRVRSLSGRSPRKTRKDFGALIHALPKSFNQTKKNTVPMGWWGWKPALNLSQSVFFLSVRSAQSGGIYGTLEHFDLKIRKSPILRKKLDREIVEPIIKPTHGVGRRLACAQCHQPSRRFSSEPSQT
jgi:hypothetical protein